MKKNIAEQGKILKMLELSNQEFGVLRVRSNKQQDRLLQFKQFN